MKRLRLHKQFPTATPVRVGSSQTPELLTSESGIVLDPVALKKWEEAEKVALKKWEEAEKKWAEHDERVRAAEEAIRLKKRLICRCGHSEYYHQPNEHLIERGFDVCGGVSRGHPACRCPAFLLERVKDVA